MSRKTVGVAFSTRNRPDTLEICLDNLVKNISPEKYDYVLVVAVDVGDSQYLPQYEKLINKYGDENLQTIWDFADERRGIAKQKNCGLKHLREKNCDYYFLFDDDCWPKKVGWDTYYIETAESNGVHHLMHQHPLPNGFNPHRVHNGVAEFNQSCGVCLFFTRHAVDVIGGYNKGFGIYGYEHSIQSMRANAAGLQPGFGPYISPEKTRDYIYSLDLDLNNWGINEFDVKPEQWRSSIHGEPISQYINHNAKFFGQINPGYQEL